MLLSISNFMCDENTAAKGWVASSFPVIKIIIVSILALLAIAMIVLVMMQKSDSNGISAISGKSDTFYNKNKGATLQGKIKILTIIDAISIFVLVLVFLILDKIYEGHI